MRLSVQIALLCASAALVAAQVPGKAFRFRPNAMPRPEPGASLLELDEATFDKLRRRVLASSSQSSRWHDGTTDREIGAFALEETLPPPSPLPPDVGFACATLPAGGDFAIPRAPIRPASFAAPFDSLPPSAAEPVRSSSDLLDLDSYPSLSP